MPLLSEPYLNHVIKIFFLKWEISSIWLEKLSGFFSFCDLSDVRQRLACGKIRWLNISEVAATTFLACSNIVHGNSVPKLQDGQTKKTPLTRCLFSPNMKPAIILFQCKGAWFTGCWWTRKCGKTSGVCFALLGTGGREAGELCSSIWRCGCRNEAPSEQQMTSQFLHFPPVCIGVYWSTENCRKGWLFFSQPSRLHKDDLEVTGCAFVSTSLLRWMKGGGRQ